MNIKNLVNFFELLNMFEPAIRISSVFVVPENNKFVLDNGFTYRNFYKERTIHDKKVYYLRSFGGEFCITPYSFFLNNSQGIFYSIGEGIYKDKETKKLLLIEIFNKNESFNFDIDILTKYFEKSSYVLDFDIKIIDRWDRTWLNISVLQK